MKLKKDFVIVAVGHFFEALILFATTRVMTSLLSPEQMGHYALIYAFVTMAFSFFIVPPALYMQRWFFEWKKKDLLVEYTCKFIMYLLMIGVISGILSVILKNLFPLDLPFDDIIIFGLVSGLVVFLNVNTLFYSALNMIQRRLSFVVCSILTGIAVLAAAFSLSFYFGKGADIWILGQIFGQFLMMIVTAILFFRAVGPGTNHAAGWSWMKIYSDLKEMIKFCWPMFIGSCVLWVQNESYRVLLSFIGGVKVVGLFAVGFSLGVKFSQKFITVINNFYNPIFFQSIASAPKKNIEKACTKYASVILPAIILLGLFISSGSHFMAVIFVAPAFQEAARIALFWSGLVCIFGGMLATYRIFAVAVMNLRVVILPYSVGALSVVVLIPLLCRSMPFMGAGIALMMGAAVSCLCLMFYVRKLLAVNFPWRRVGEALLWALPFVAVGFGLSRMMPNPGIAQSLVVICVLGVLELAAQLKLARPWLVVRKLAE